MDISAQKRRLRRAARAKNAALPQAARQAASRALTAHLPTLERLGNHASPLRFALFASMPHEIDTRPLARALEARGHEVLLPRIENKHLAFIPAPFGTWAQLPRDTWDIPIPQGGAASLHSLAAVVCPGLLFSPNGNRLGQGGGFYDRTLAGHQVTRIGLGYTHQVHTSVPCEAHDVRLTHLWTPDGIHTCEPLSKKT